LRKGKLTASNAQCIAYNGKGLESYVYSLLAEKYSNNRDNYTNNDIQRGVELEEQARMTYEIENSKVEQVGFIEMNKYVGCSPDGLIGKQGGLEIKCPNDKNYFMLLVNGQKEIKAEYIWQCQMSMLIAEREWWDLCFYNPNFEKNMLVFKIMADQEKFAKLRTGIDTGIRLIKQIEKKLKGGGKI
jgi:exodeoxyribonuclease (lambda-induced)